MAVSRWRDQGVSLRWCQCTRSIKRLRLAGANHQHHFFSLMMRRTDCKFIKTARPFLMILLRAMQYGFCYSQSYICFSHQKVVRAVGNKKCDFYTETRGFECVPYYQVYCTFYTAWIRLIMISKISLIRVELQCDDDRTIITDGAGLIDIRWTTIYCSRSSPSSSKTSLSLFPGLVVKVPS